MKTPSLITLLLLALVMIASAENKPAAKDSSTSKDAAKSTDKDKPKGGDNGLQSISSLIPEGVKNMKVKIPGFDQGRPTSLVTADSMTRLNPRELYAEGVIIHLYGKEPKDNMRVDMKTATYHTDTSVLTSKDRTKVVRSDFTIEGDSIVYYTESGKGSMKGHVHMVLYNAAKMAPKQEPAPTAASGAPAQLPPANP
jgi:hypothetical protein